MRRKEGRRVSEWMNEWMEEEIVHFSRTFVCYSIARLALPPFPLFLRPLLLPSQHDLQCQRRRSGGCVRCLVRPRRAGPPIWKARARSVAGREGGRER
jgi:hypothetical protein